MKAKRKSGAVNLEAKFKTLFDWSHDAIIVTNREGQILEVNRSGIDLFGYGSIDDLLSLGSSAALFTSQEDLYRIQESVLKEGYVKDFETQLVGEGGRVFDALVRSSLIDQGDGENCGQVIIIKDVSRQKRALKRIEGLRARLATLHTVSMTTCGTLNLNEVLERTIDQIVEILEAASVRVYMLDEEEKYLNLVAHKGLSANFLTKSFFNRRKVGVGLLGQTVLTRGTKVVDNYLRAEDPYVDYIIEEGLQSSVYIPLLSKDKPVGALCVSSHSEFKFSDAFVEFLTNIGNQIGLAIENANLYEATKRAYQELSEAQEQVIQTEKLASLGKLAATIAHEINNPLSVVLTYIKLMRKLVTRDHFTRERLDDISRYLSTMESETARCGDSVKNLLTFARQAEIAMEDHCIEEILDRTLTLVDHDLEMREMQLAKDIKPDLPQVRCDFRLIQQAFLNLMINATEAMEKGGTLTVTASSSRKEGFVKVAISDTGCGIPEKHIRNIFEPFFTTKEETKGVGLGLAVVYGIITKHGGSIDVKSELGKGSTFEVYLPIAK